VACFLAYWWIAQHPNLLDVIHTIRMNNHGIKETKAKATARTLKGKAQETPGKSDPMMSRTN